MISSLPPSSPAGVGGAAAPFNVNRTRVLHVQVHAVRARGRGRITPARLSLAPRATRAFCCCTAGKLAVEDPLVARQPAHQDQCSLFYWRSQSSPAAAWLPACPPGCITFYRSTPSMTMTIFYFLSLSSKSWPGDFRWVCSHGRVGFFHPFLFMSLSREWTFADQWRFRNHRSVQIIFCFFLFFFFYIAAWRRFIRWFFEFTLAKNKAFIFHTAVIQEKRILKRKNFF